MQLYWLFGWDWLLLDWALVEVALPLLEFPLKDEPPAPLLLSFSLGWLEVVDGLCVLPLILPVDSSYVPPVDPSRVWQPAMSAALLNMINNFFIIWLCCFTRRDFHLRSSPQGRTISLPLSTNSTSLPLAAMGSLTRPNLEKQGELRRERRVPALRDRHKFAQSWSSALRRVLSFWPFGFIPRTNSGCGPAYPSCQTTGETCRHLWRRLHLLSPDHW